MIDLNKAIIPEKEIGGIFLGSSISDIKPLLDSFVWKNDVSGGNMNHLESPYVVCYENKGCLAVSVNLLLNKVCKIVALAKYKGKFSGVGIGSTVNDLKRIDEGFFFDENEEAFISPKHLGIAFYVDSFEPNSNENVISEISVYEMALLQL